MNKILTLIVCAAALVSCGSAQQPTPIKVISYNIRMSAAPDADGDNRWENRKQASINMINDQQPTLLGLQEACPDQVAFLDSNLPDYKRIGVGREDGKAEGNVMIVNESINNYPQQVEFIRNDTQEVIYQSKAIPVGSKIERAALDVELPAGTYECTAMFHNLDPVSGEIIGTAGAIINITIKN